MAKIGTLRPFKEGADFTRQLNKVFRDFYDALNKQLTFGDNFKGAILNVKASPNEEFAFLHGLRDTPSRVLILNAQNSTSLVNTTGVILEWTLSGESVTASFKGVESGNYNLELLIS